MVKKKMIDELNKKGQELRAKALNPLFSLLTKWRIRAGHITFARLLGLVLFFFWWNKSSQLAVIALLVAIFLDWFDGGLARYQKRSSDRGKFWDVLVDHVLYVGSIWILIYWGTVSAVTASYQLFITPILFLLATVAASEEMKTDWIIHPYYRIVYLKPFPILALILITFFQVDIFPELLLILNIVMSVLTLYYTQVLIDRWNHEDK